MIGAAATASAVVLLLALKQPGTSVAEASSQAGSQVPPAGSASAGNGAGAGRTVLGDSAGTQYGDVQVQLTLSGGRITGAQAVKAPSAEAKSRQIAADAIPRLNQAVLRAQSAQIDAVSGASYTSEGYIKSLQSALDKAAAVGSGAETAGSGSGSGSGETAGSGSGSGSNPGSGSGSGSGGAPAAKTVLGNVADTQYGPVQVRITVSGGKVTAADAVKAPDSDANSRRIAATAVPQLNQAALTAQSAQIDAVSGASYTSEGYIKSLQSALDKAGL
ncbi:FMN-binding protein [Streptomyces sp. NBC_01481]|uniref:FMN-binding protein n=1 Tax=Streptomyces sp. NBC_01481 TaxID=2975869 RepID=UPI0022524B71|nr:FMN-binding protein [Streptomyces sp. NBC_01481]MCX4583375.1 FMN-binding protein [Streptomyces sp. NBC_01481]